MVKPDCLFLTFLAPALISLPGTHSANLFMRDMYACLAVAVSGVNGSEDSISRGLMKNALKALFMLS